MAMLDSIIMGMEIARKYVGGDAYHIAAEHDEIFLYPIPNLTDADHDQLHKLGWRYDKHAGGWAIHV